MKIFRSKSHFSLETPDSDEDHAWLVELHNDPIVLRNLTNPEPITLENHLNWWKQIEKSSKEQRFIFTVHGQRVGFTKFYQIDSVNKNCVLGADIHRLFRGMGYANIMWGMMLDFCFDDVSLGGLGLHRVSLTTAEYNVIGQKVYKKLGFLDEGNLKESLFRDGKFWDQRCMFLLKDNWKANKPEP